MNRMMLKFSQKNHTNFEAFSLVEVVMALGIISFALVAIMGLFPVAMQSAQDSQRETRAAFIARQVFSDLRSMPPAETFIAASTNFLADKIAVNLGTAATYDVTYDIDGNPLGTTPTSSSVFKAKVLVSPSVPTSGLTQVQMEITAVSTPTTKPYTFITILDN